MGGVVAFVVGVVMYIAARRGVRVGDDPHCPRCDYNCTGITAHRCPECGHTWRDELLVIGTRQRRRGLWYTSLFCIALGLVVLSIQGFNWSRHHNWWQHAPLSWVISGVIDGDQVAEAELIVRYACGDITPDTRLSKRTHAKLVDALLAIQKRRRVNWFPWDRRLQTLGGFRDGNLMTLLHGYYSDSRLTPAQEETYHRQAAHLDVAFRTPVRATDPWPISVSFDADLPFRRFDDHEGVQAIQPGLRRVTLSVGSVVLLDQPHSHRGAKRTQPGRPRGRCRPTRRNGLAVSRGVGAHACLTV